MNEKKLIVILFVLLFFVNYPILDFLLVSAFESKETGIVERIVDGDTIVVSGEKIRLLGINTPERGEYLYEEAKVFLEKINGSKVELEFGKNKYDKYGRKLGYVFYNGNNINLELIEEGLANPYFPSLKDEYYDDFFYSWKNCMSENKNLCQNIIEPCINFDWTPEKDIVVIQEICGKNFDLTGFSIKDEGRKKYVFERKILAPYEKTILTSKDFSEEYVWTKTGDSIFIRDSNQKLVFFNSY